MMFERVETILHLLAGLLAYISLGVLCWGIWRGAHRKAGLTTGYTGSWLRSPWFYWVLSVLFFGGCILGWVPVPLLVPRSIRLWMLGIGSLLYFPGVLFLLWGRWALGENYFVSSALGSQLFSNHQLVTNGPFAFVRHPMYTGLILAALGSLLVYLTWTTLFFTICAPMIAVRARREEEALATEFGDQWQEYCKRVPAFFPRLEQ
jgi:protein-S-isoprenylcysteine O-methyltransferase Ste14